MYYSMDQGVQATWRDYTQTITKHFSSQYVLPTAIAAFTGLWLGLIVIAYNQTSPVGPPTSPHISRAHTGQALSVSYSQPTPMTSTPTSSSTATNTTTAKPATTTNTAASSPLSTMAASMANTPSNLLSSGGKGADTPAAPTVLSQPAVPATGTITDPLLSIPVAPAPTNILNNSTNALPGVTGPLGL